MSCVGNLLIKHIFARQPDGNHLSVVHTTILCSREPHPSTHKAAGESDAPQPRADVIPHSYTAPADPLANSQFQEEERNSDEDEQHQIWDQVGTWQEKEWPLEMLTCGYAG